MNKTKIRNDLNMLSLLNFNVDDENFSYLKNSFVLKYLLLNSDQYILLLIHRHAFDAFQS